MTQHNTGYDVQQIRVALVRPGSNDRTIFDEDELQKLAASIKKDGLLQPITVRPIRGEIGVILYYEIVAGERRFRAIAHILQWETVPAIVRELTDEEASALMLVENTARVDLDPISEALAFSIRVNKLGWTVERVAETAGRSVQVVKDRIALLAVIPEVQHFIRLKQFPIGHALAMTDLDANRQRIAFRVFTEAVSMPLSRFLDVVHRLRDEQGKESQMDMFALELQLVQEVVTDSQPTYKGKRARTGAPTNTKLPRVRIKMTDTVGDILDRYIADLLQAGDPDAAAALGNVYNTLVAFNWASVPTSSPLAKVGEESAETLAHYEKL